MKMRKGFTLIELLTWIALVLLVLGFFRGFLITEETAIKAFEVRGFSEVQIKDKDVFLLGLRGGEFTDAAIFEASAVNPVGKKVEVYICIGWPLKGAVLRSR